MQWKAALLAAFLAVASAAAQSSAPAPATASATAADAQRLSDLLELIEGQNTVQARRTGARELLRAELPETAARLVQLLLGTNRSAKIAVAEALAESPQFLSDAYLAPLLAMLEDSEADVRRAAAAALACFTSATSRLRAGLLDQTRPSAARLAALEALGGMTGRDAVATLIEVLDDADPALQRAALDALELMTGVSFQADAALARNWWREHAALSADAWQEFQIARLARKAREAEQRGRDLEQRLTSALRESYLRRTETERGEQLAGFLADALPPVRLLGLELVQAQIAEGRAVSGDALRASRALLEAPDANVRAVAVRTIAGLRDESDAELFTRMLASERDAEVRVALAYGLGYAGGASAVGVLTSLINAQREPAALEAAVSLGRLAERAVLEGAARESAVAAVLAAEARVPRDDMAARERILRAMGRIADPRFVACLGEALDAQQPPLVRQAALRALAALHAALESSSGGDGEAARREAAERSYDFILRCTLEPDAALRRQAVETLAQNGAGERTLEALWRLSAAAHEPDAGVREAAWRGVLRLLAGRAASELERWIARLPADDEAGRQRLDLLLLGERAADLTETARRAEWRVRVAAQRAKLGESEAALQDYLAALPDLPPAQVGAAKLDLLRLALLADRFDASLADALKAGFPVEIDVMWEVLESVVGRQLARPEDVDRAVAALERFGDGSLAALSGELLEKHTTLLKQARQTQLEVDARRVRAAVERVRERGIDDAAAVASSLGPRAALMLRDALRGLLQAEASDAGTETILYALLRAAAPDWPGYSPGDPPLEKLRALESAHAPAVSSGPVTSRRD